jgi:hypothetical protein
MFIQRVPVGRRVRVFRHWAAVLVGVLSLSAAACESVMKRPCRPLPKDDSKTPAPTFCNDLTNIPADSQAHIRGLVNAYAGAVKFAEASLQTPQRLNTIDGPVWSQVIAAQGNNGLTVADFEVRGRIVAQVATQRQYAHGITTGIAYLWVERHRTRGWRVLMIPRDSLQPIAVMPMIHVDTAIAGMRDAAHGVASIMTDMPDSLWKETMTPEVASCYSQGFGACWVHTASATPEKRDDVLEDGPSDVWVFVTGQGCVCVGNKCHSYIKKSQGEHGK